MHYGAMLHLLQFLSLTIAPCSNVADVDQTADIDGHLVACMPVTDQVDRNNRRLRSQLPPQV